MRNDGRWRLTDGQRVAVIVAVVVALFLSSMSWGMDSLEPLIVAVLVLVAAGVGIFMLGLQYTSSAPVRADAHVITASPPPVGGIVGRCDMQLLVEIAGLPARILRFRDPSVHVIKWPRPGMVLPVEVTPRSARPLRIMWDLVPSRRVRASTPREAAGAHVTPFYTDYVDRGGEQDYPGGTEQEYLGWTEQEYLDDVGQEYLNEVGQEYLDVGQAPFPPAPSPASDPETVRMRGDHVLDGEIVVAGDNADNAQRGAGDDLPRRVIPQPRDARPAGADPEAMGIMLIVSDLARSVRFYTELLNFTVVDINSGSAVLASGGGRILLRRAADMSPVDGRVVFLHIHVPDIEFAYRDLKARGVEFVHRPRVMNRGDRLELWATFRDPDGHTIAITQWRERV